MNLRDLEYLVALDKWKHFGRAAEESFVSQPTLSGQIKKMEDELGVTLIERGKGQFIFTEPGLRILERAKKVLSEVSEIYEIADSFTNPMVGRVKFGIIPSIAPFLLPLIIEEFYKRFPDIDFVLLEQQTHIIEENLTKGDLDMAILALPIDGELFHQESLYIEPFYLAVYKNHPLANKKEVSIEDLGGETLLLLEEGHCFGDQVVTLCHRNPQGHYNLVRGTSLETIVHMVRLGRGITLLPELTIKQKSYDFMENPLIYIPFKSPIPSRDVGIIYRKSSPKRECYKAIGKSVAEVVGEKLNITKKRLDIIPI